MNKRIPMIIMSMSAVLLAACDSGISQEKFVSQLENTKANVTLDSNILDNVHIQDKSSLNQINYKEGEFYSYASGLILTNVREYIWKDEDGKFYHYKKSLVENVDEEITEESFNIKMATKRGEICAKVNEGIMECENLLKDEPTGYISNVKNSFYKTVKGEYRLNSTMTYKVSEEVEEQTRKVIFLMKNNKPIKYTVKLDSESTVKYSYGNAKFSAPERNTTGE